MRIALLLLVACVSFCSSQSPIEYHSSLAYNMLSTAFFPLRHPQVENADRLAARSFTERYMRALALNVTRQVFQTTVLHDRDIARRVEGVNLISLLPGQNWNTGKEDHILLLAAHYDSDVTNLGVRPGSGMVVLLEVARNLQRLRLVDKQQLKHTVLLVACDLFTSAHLWGKAGDSGLDVFVKNYLNELLQLRSSVRFRGAIILDSVFNYNTSVGTQTYPEGFAETFPGTKTNGVGDFLAAVGRQHSENTLLEALTGSWSGGPAKLQPLVLNQQPPQSEALREIFKMGVNALWNREDAGIVNSLPAIVLTDTGRFRSLPGGCQTSSRHMCTPSIVLTEKRMKLVNQTIDAVTDAIVLLQGGASAMMASYILGTVSLLTVLLRV